MRSGGVCGVVGGMMVIVMLAGTMRRGCGGIAAVVIVDECECKLQ